MSEQKHTPEPWSIGRYGEISASTSDNFGGRINLVGVSTPMTAGPDMNEAKANARRIVACVNACKGLPTETLEQMDPDIDMLFVDCVEHIINQRDQLLAALKNLHKVIDSAGVMSLMNGVELGPVVWSIKANDAMEYAGEVIAAVEGGNKP